MNPGDKVRYRGPGGTGVWEGVIAFDEPDAVLMEVNPPVPMLKAPDAIMVEEVDDRMYLPETTMLGYGTRWLLEDLGIEVPSGKFTDSTERIYEIEKPMKVSEIMALCRKHHGPDPGDSSSSFTSAWRKRKIKIGEKLNPLCWLQSVMLTAIPLAKKGRYSGDFEVL